MTDLVSVGELEVFLEAHEQWVVEHDSLVRDFRFADFVQAFSWMSAMALVAERMNHHPEWSNTYNRVSVCLKTHTANGITRLDFALAEAMDKAAASHV